MIVRSTAVGLFVTAIAATSAIAEVPVRLSITSALPENHTALGIVRARFQDEISRRVKDAGAGDIVWDEMHDGTLARTGGVLEAVEDDLVQFGIVSVGHEQRRLPLQSLTFQMPFTTEDCAIVGDAYQAVHTGVDGMTESFDAARQMFLSGIASDGFNFVALQKLRNAAEVRGVLVGTTSRIDPWIAGVQGQPVRLPPDALAGRLEDGSLGAALLPTTEIGRLGLKLHADHYTRTGFGAQVPYVLTVNSRAFDALPEAVRTAVREAASAFTRIAAQDYCAAGDAALATLKAQGVRTTKLLKSRRFQWADALSPIAQQWAQDNDKAGRPGSAAVSLFMGRLRDAGVKITRDWARPPALGSIEAPGSKPGEVSQASAK